MIEGVLQVTVSAGTREEATRLVTSAVEARLAACGQVLGPVQSTYWWDGRVQQGDEWQCVLKTTRERYLTLEAHIRAMHSYRNPEVLGVAVAVGSDEYLKWLYTETDSPDRGSP